jgi:hypothetical protein
MKKPKEVPRQVNTEKSLIAIVTNLRMAVHGLKELQDGIMGVVDVLDTFLNERPIQATPAQVLPAQVSPVSLEELRTAAINLRNNGGRDALPGLIAKYGAAKLSAVSPVDRPALLADILEFSHGS